MKDFMLLFKGIHYDDVGMSPKELQAKMAKWSDWSTKLAERGVLKGGDALKNAVRNMEGPDQLITDRTSAELKEVIGGYFVVSVKDIEEATEIARSYPDFDLPGGAVQIREILRYDY